MASNPFTPTFGVTPPYLAGRDNSVDEFVEGLDEGVGSPFRAQLVIGARGTGKTVLLNRLEDTARERHWEVVSATASPGIAEDVAASTMANLLHDLDPDARVRDITGGSGSVMGSGGSTQTSIDNRVPWPTVTFRSALARLADLVDQAHPGSGVLVTLDEIHPQAIDDLRIITHAIQHCFREGRQVAFVGAGLPASMSTLLNDPLTTFLRRAEPIHLGRIADADVARALRNPIQAGGRDIDDDALHLAVRGTRGYPFLVQLVGFHTWRAGADEPLITRAHVEAAVEAAVRRAGRMIHEPSLSGLSPVDRSFLSAMAVDDSPSTITDIASRLGVDTNYANQYRARLIAAELIEPAGRGRLDFALPYLRDYLLEHAVTQSWTRTPGAGAAPSDAGP